MSKEHKGSHDANLENTKHSERKDNHLDKAPDSHGVRNASGEEIQHAHDKNKNKFVTFDGAPGHKMPALEPGMSVADAEHAHDQLNSNRFTILMDNDVFETSDGVSRKQWLAQKTTDHSKKPVESAGKRNDHHIESKESNESKESDESKESNESKESKESKGSKGTKDKFLQFETSKELQLTDAEVDLLEKKIIEGKLKHDYDPHLVKDGDNLWDIAKRHYGNARAFGIIFEANRMAIAGAQGVAPENADPRKIDVGTLLRLPKVGRHAQPKTEYW
jgi:hypothetical protein